MCENCKEWKGKILVGTINHQKHYVIYQLSKCKIYKSFYFDTTPYSVKYYNFREAYLNEITNLLINQLKQ